jgi:hypothetical protein
MATLVMIAPNRASISKMWDSLGELIENNAWTQTKRILGKKKVYYTISGPLKILLKIRTALLYWGFEVGALKVNGEIRKKPAKPKKRRRG